MNLYVIQPYHGIDVDSINGLNGGDNLDPIEVNAIDEQEAISKVIDMFILAHGLDKSQLNKSRGTINQIISYHRQNGEEISQNEYLSDSQDGDFYKYEYVDFNKVTRKG